jgi:hypothetical protein
LPETVDSEVALALPPGSVYGVSYLSGSGCAIPEITGELSGIAYLPDQAMSFLCRCHRLRYRSVQQHDARVDEYRRHPEKLRCVVDAFLSGGKTMNSAAVRAFLEQRAPMLAWNARQASRNGVEIGDCRAFSRWFQCWRAATPSPVLSGLVSYSLNSRMTSAVSRASLGSLAS